MEKILIVGSSGHAKVVIDIVQRDGRYVIAGLIDSVRAIGEQTLGCRVLGREEDLPRLADTNAVSGLLVAVGDNFLRAMVVARASKLCPTLSFPAAIHPRANIATDVSIGEGSVIMANAIANPGCTVGRFCILNTNSSLDHDSIMDDFSSLAPAAATGGNCRIGSYSAVSIGAVLAHKVCIGEHTVIGAGATVLEDIGAFQVAYGAPAKAIRARQAGDKYL
jgi:sugar O-acyltransferase (sialic acid O-acetyltransferase NeuD family)